MKLQTSRAKEIETWIKDHPECETDEHEPIQIAGELQLPRVWRVPIKLLVYNIRNGRFASELIAKERDLKRKLDPRKKDDAGIIRQLLLDQSPTETEALSENIRRYGQLQPGIITFDGAVINANRRMAVISKLHEETGDTKFEYLKVARLPQSVSEIDLWRIEAGLQFAKEFLLDYGPVNELLKLREGHKQGLNPKEISATLLGRYSEGQIEDKLEILKQIESYLAFTERSFQYDEVTGDVEKFNSLVKNVLQPLKRQGLSATERSAVNLIAFSLIKSGSKDIRHWEIRKLREVMSLPEAKAEIFKVYNAKNPAKTPIANLVDAFTTAIELVEDKKVQEKPEKLLRKALSAVKTINPRNPRVKDKSVRDLLTQLQEEIKRLWKFVKP
jgi:hypothetical protein